MNHALGSTSNSFAESVVLLLRFPASVLNFGARSVRLRGHSRNPPFPPSVAWPGAHTHPKAVIGCGPCSTHPIRAPTSVNDAPDARRCRIQGARSSGEVRTALYLVAGRPKCLRTSMRSPALACPRRCAAKLKQPLPKPVSRPSPSSQGIYYARKAFARRTGQVAYPTEGRS